MLTRRGFETAIVKPALDVTNNGEFGQGQHPEQSFSTRLQYQDSTIRGGLSSDLQRSDFARSALSPKRALH